MLSDAIIYLDKLGVDELSSYDICKELRKEFNINVINFGDERAFIEYRHAYFKVALNLEGMTSNKRSYQLYKYTPLHLRKYLAQELPITDRVALTRRYATDVPVTKYEIRTILKLFRENGIIIYDADYSYQWGRNNGAPILLDHTYWKPIWMSEFTRYNLENLDLERLCY